ncbi:hypothetical protein SAMN06265365_105228 [Tistlia consotensis]|uniref:Uncharacterized protein n=1 Tax=Tistlia consotensis USBA 355 TaxID=560819 RepID=A0A1Y6BN14_9PROT|nr:hypothetical protein [Tistlia consotensis]SMF12208.1 hypothetical protein SAMN05428998_10570 [Tistlia consotensis USBA 355]SNR51280.1 hypothetical protein SAMN06265365_105228 [Tistlia consotensis]
MRSAVFALLLGVLLTAVSAVPATRAGSASIDRDPLRRLIPSPELYMPVPGGQLGIGSRVHKGETIEQIKAQADGGIVVGYCLRAACSHITHLVVMQVCGNAVGGPGGADRLVLGVVRLPYGRTDGYIKTLQGRDYAENFATYGPAEQILPAAGDNTGSGLLALQTVGMGPVQPLVFEGMRVASPQSRDTLALQMVAPRGGAKYGLQNARIEIRHLCQKHLS